MNKSILIFPVQRDNTPFVRNCGELGGFVAIPVLPPIQKYLEGMDLATIDGGNLSDIKLTTDFYKSLDICEIVYLDYSLFITKSLYFDYMAEVRRRGKKIVISSKLQKSLGIVTERDEELYQTADKILNFKVPIISVFGMGDNCDQSNVELLLRKFFIQKGYKLSQIGTQDYCELLGFKSIPSFIFEEINGEKKRILFNHYVSDILKKEKPDLMIIGVPNAIMKYSNKILLGMGDVPCIIQDAIQSDIGIICTHFKEFQKKYFEELKLFSKYRLNCISDYFNIANVKLIYDEEHEDKLDYLQLDNKFVIENIDFDMAKDDNLAIFNSFDQESTQKVFTAIEQELLANCDVIQGGI